jgi:hypothetical protein
MKKLFLILCVLPIFNACYSPERDCAKFKTGTFQFESYLNGELVTSTFVRNDSLEIDKFQGKIDTSSVRWINDCEYIIKNLHPKNRAERKALHIKILTSDKNTYTFEYGLVGKTEKQRGTVTKID